MPVIAAYVIGTSRILSVVSVTTYFIAVLHREVVAEDHPVQVQEEADRDGQHRPLAEEVAVAAVALPEGKALYYVRSSRHAADGTTTVVVFAMEVTGAVATSRARSQGAARSAARRGRGSLQIARRRFPSLQIRQNRRPLPTRDQCWTPIATDASALLGPSGAGARR